jgi:hypothetical protein
MHTALRHYLQSVFIDYVPGTKKISVYILAVELLLLILFV